MICITCGTQFSPPGLCPGCKWDTDATHDAASIAAPGVVLDARYSIQKFLGSGRFGVCFRATDLKLNAEVVVKFIHPAYLPTPPHFKRFIDGIAALRENNHRTVAKLLDVGQLNGNVYVSNEYLNGGSLADLLNARVCSQQPFTINEIYPIFKETASCLIEGPTAIHGALCPKNIFIQSGNIKILDCGLVANLPEAVVGYRLASTSKRRRYVAPEMVAGNGPRTRSDVYSMGVILGEMLTLRKYDGRPTMFRETNPALPNGVDEILSCSLAENPKYRYKDAEVLLSALSDVAGLPAPRFSRIWVSNEDSSIEDISHIQEDKTAQIVMKDVIQQHFEEVTSMKEPEFRGTPPPPKPTPEQPLPKPVSDQSRPQRTSAPSLPRPVSAPPVVKPPKVGALPKPASIPAHLGAHIAMPKPSIPFSSPSPNNAAPPPTSKPVERPRSSEQREGLEGINPRFLRAAQKLQTSPPEQIQPAAQDSAIFSENEDWRDRISQETSTNEDSIVSFLAPPSNGKNVPEVPKPSSAPPPPPPPRAKKPQQ